MADFEIEPRHFQRPRPPDRCDHFARLHGIVYTLEQPVGMGNEAAIMLSVIDDHDPTVLLEPFGKNDMPPKYGPYGLSNWSPEEESSMVEDILGIRSDFPDGQCIIITGQRWAEEALLSGKGERGAVYGPSVDSRSTLPVISCPLRRAGPGIRLESCEVERVSDSRHIRRSFGSASRGARQQAMIQSQEGPSAVGSGLRLRIRARLQKGEKIRQGSVFVQHIQPVLDQVGLEHASVGNVRRGSSAALTPVGTSLPVGRTLLPGQTGGRAGLVLPCDPMGQKAGAQSRYQATQEAYQRQD